jgi:hypothetical protein
VYYRVHNQWALSTCYYYACQVLNGNMFDTPSQVPQSAIAHLTACISLAMTAFPRLMFRSRTTTSAESGSP